MTTMVSEETRAFLYAHAFGPDSAAVGVIAILLLIALLLQKELLWASGRSQARGGAALSTVIIAPLLFAFVVIVGQRLADILHP